MIPISKITLLSTLICLSGLTLIPITISCGEISKDFISISWENNINHLDELHTSIKATANVNISSNLDAEINDGWTYDNLPSSISESHNGNSIIFVLNTNVSTIATTFSLHCTFQNIKSNSINFSVTNITPINYDYEILLSSNNGTLTQSNFNIILIATIIKLNPLAPDPSTISVDWTVPSHYNFFTHTISGNQITFALTNPGQEETIANDYAVQASYNPGQTNGAATKTFTLKTEDWIYWASNWIPKNLLSINNTTLNGLIPSANIGNYDTLKIPREIKTIVSNAFANNLIGIKYIDFDSSTVETIGDSAFNQIDKVSTFEGRLLLPNTLKSLKPYSFRNTNFSDIDMSSCNLLTRIDYGAFSECSNIENVEFNNNLREFQEPPTSAAGAFEMSTGKSKFKGILTLPTSIQKIGGRAFYQFGNGQQIGQTDGIELNWVNCTQLTTIGGISFENVYFKPNTSLVLPNSIKSIGLTCFFGTHNLTHVTLGTSITSMGANCFSESDVNVVTILKTNGIYQYNFESNTANTEYSNMNFGKWLRATNIERWSDPDVGPTGSASGAYIEVPQALLSQYQSWAVITATNQINIRGY